MRCLLLLAGAVGLVLSESFYYKSENDYEDIDAVIADLPTFLSYVHCFLDQGPCTSQTESYKRIVQASITNACERCNVPQKQRYAKFLVGLREKLPHYYLAFRQMYDPYGIYFNALEEELFKYLDYSPNIPQLCLPYYYRK